MPLADAFRLRMRQLGWLSGRNIVIAIRSASGDYVKLARDAGELVSAKVDVLVAMGTPGVRAIQQHSRTLPVVFTLVADPVSQGLINNLSHPGGVPPRRPRKKIPDAGAMHSSTKSAV